MEMLLMLLELIEIYILKELMQLLSRMAFPLSGKEEKRCSMIPYIELTLSLIRTNGRKNKFSKR